MTKPSSSLGDSICAIFMGKKIDQDFINIKLKIKENWLTITERTIANVKCPMR